jgi:orotidine-5'-phosphate decarboxylase
MAAKLVVALDYSSAEDARSIINRLHGVPDMYKVGLQLFTVAGPDFVRELTEIAPVFLDLKFHDIPNTVAKAVGSAASLGASMLTVHCSGGPKMLRAAADAARSAANPPVIMGVTVLTSLDASDLSATGVSSTAEEQVLRLAGVARDSGIDGIVCSAHEIKPVRGKVSGDLKLLVPGIRPAGAAQDDQRRVATPAEAASWGADYIVIGRPITAATDPLAAARNLKEEIAGSNRKAGPQAGLPVKS